MKGGVMRILNVYQWATVGGVERVLLNRAWAFKKHGISVRQDVFFYHDSGGLRNFRLFIKYFQLEEYISVVSQIDESAYDYIFSFDTPQVFEFLKNTSKVVVECHSPYDKSRVYLKSLPKDIARVVTPSSAFMDSVVVHEIPDAFKDRLFILPNFHTLNGREPVSPERIWGKTPVCYIGRMDTLKNTKELLEIFASLRKKPGDDHFLLLVGDVRPHYMDVKEAIKKLRIEDRAAYYRPIPFEKVDVLLTKIKQHNGIFISPSMGESFGLSALEAMSNGVPVLLADIECHKPLVESDPVFLYRQGDIGDAISKFEHISRNYDELSASVARLSANYSSTLFIEAWNALFAGL